MSSFMRSFEEFETQIHIPITACCVIHYTYTFAKDGGGMGWGWMASLLLVTSHTPYKGGGGGTDCRAEYIEARPPACWRRVGGWPWLAG